MIVDSEKNEIRCNKCRSLIANIGEDNQFLRLGDVILWNIAYLTCRFCNKTYRWKASCLESLDDEEDD
jgi:hypothetical protein